jgi:uncharacterized protein YecT (DUF1311 family)
MLKHLSIALAFIFFVSFARQAVAECDNVYGNMEMIGCEKSEYDKANKELQALVLAIKKNMHPDETKHFDDANAAWLSYRKAHCWSAATLYDAGSMGGLVEMKCHADLTKQRIKQLRQDFADRLTPPSKSPPAPE